MKTILDWYFNAVSAVKIPFLNNVLNDWFYEIDILQKNINSGFEPQVFKYPKKF